MLVGRADQGMHLWGVALIGLVTAVVFANSLGGGFHFDDEHSLVKNPAVRHLEQVGEYFVDPELFSRNPGSAMYRPVLLLSYALNHWAGGYASWGYHLVNITIHGLVGALVWALFIHLGQRPGWALGAALLFVVHPLATEPVNYISSRSESLAALFVLLAFVLYIRGSARAGVGAVGSFALGLATKATALSLPLLLLLYGWRTGADWRRIGQRQWPFWALALAYVWGSQNLLREAVVETPVRSWTAQLSTQTKALVYYFKLAAMPRGQSVEHQFFVAPTPVEPAVIAALVLFASLAWLVFRQRQEWIQAVFWLGWMGLVLLPTVLVPLNVLVSERRFYLALVGFLGLLLHLAQHSGPSRGALVGGIGIFLVAVPLTIQRNQIWHSPERLWTQARDRAPLMVRPHLQLGSIYRKDGRFSAAAAAYRQALELEPANGAAHNNMGNLYRDLNQLDLAQKSYDRALAIRPDYPEALVNLAGLHRAVGRPQKAIDLLEKARLLAGQREEVFNNLGTVYLGIERYAEAEENLRQAQALAPDSPTICFNLGGALEGQGRLREAAALYQRAIGLDSTYAKAYYNLGLVRQGQGRRRAAALAYAGFLRHWQGSADVARQVRRRLEGWGYDN